MKKIGRRIGGSSNINIFFLGRSYYLKFSSQLRGEKGMSEGEREEMTEGRGRRMTQEVEVRYD